ncbi:MAG: metallopeptidase family protein [Chloroflexi bacterium]|nr:metallopeptidase family protein [Chloroflexota bacterium]
MQPRRIRRVEFERLVEKAVRSLPAEVADRLDNVVIVVEDWPDRDQLSMREGNDRYSLLGLYQGIPLTEREGYGMVLPDRISIFRRPIEALALNREGMIEEIRKTVLHEIAHHFGFSDDELERIGYG